MSEAAMQARAKQDQIESIKEYVRQQLITSSKEDHKRGKCVFKD